MTGEGRESMDFMECQGTFAGVNPGKIACFEKGLGIVWMFWTLVDL
jgi:hypothetical protein